MTSGRDDEALSWAGDDDPTLDTGGAAAEADASPAVLPEGFTAVGRGSDRVRGADDAVRGTTVDQPQGDEHDAVSEADAQAARLGNGALIGLGIFGGVYLLYTIGWIIGGLRLQEVALFVVSPAVYVPFLVLAVLAPAIWFAASFLLTRRSRTWVRMAWLAVGVVLLVPWPFIMVGAVGQ